jgi:hypothetical protein
VTPIGGWWLSDRSRRAQREIALRTTNDVLQLGNGGGIVSTFRRQAVDLLDQQLNAIKVHRRDRISPIGINMLRKPIRHLHDVK